jgi:hypothetical protein
MLWVVSSINELVVIFFVACGRHGCKGFCDARIYQETFIGVWRSVNSEISLHISGLSKTGIRKVRVKPVL